MKSDDFVKYLSIAGSICSIMGLFIAMSVKLNWVEGISIVLSFIGGVSLLAFILWGINEGYKSLMNKDWWPTVYSLKVLYYFCFGLVSVFVAFGFALVIFGIVNVSLTGLVEMINSYNGL